MTRDCSPRIDIAVNLTDPMFQGKYHGRKRHDPDLPAVLERAKGKGVERILITGTSLEESREALNMAKQYSELFHTEWWCFRG